MTTSLTVDDLVRWEEHGATWRPLDVSDDHAVIELCTCYGEPVEVGESDAPELIEYVRTHKAP